MSIVIGIDGGGSTVRAAVVNETLAVLGQAQGGTANPNAAGRAAAARTIQTAVQAALANAGLPAAQISTVGIGVAGADMAHSETWLREVVAGVLPDVLVVPSSDHEIALTGAHGDRRGILVLAGTGSLACGANGAGDYVKVGGWGYLLGDEGSGYWLGSMALRAVARADDGRDPATTLTAALLERLALPDARALIGWLYGAPRTADVAALAGLVLEQAAGDRTAKAIVETGARELALAARAVRLRLGVEALPVAFAGGLLAESNPLSRLLCDFLGLDEIPVPRYPPVIGAAILALRQIPG